MPVQYRVKQTGLMRCCLKRINVAMATKAEPPTNGDTLCCKWCSDEHGMIFRNGAWQWAAPIAMAD